MGENSSIAWTDHTFNPWWGCEKVSAGCSHCYAEAFAHRLGHGLSRPKLWGPGSERKIASESMWLEPLRWNRVAERARRRARVFCASMADVFEDRAELRAPRARLHLLITATPHLDWLLLTKRPENALQLWHLAALHARDAGGDDVANWQPNVWLGTTVEDQARAEERIPHLLATPAKVRFLSCEPLLEAVDLSRLLSGCEECQWTGQVFAHSRGCRSRYCALAGGVDDCDGQVLPCGCGIDWVIAGGESGHGARPFDLAWARSLRDQCRAAGVAFFFKQAGAKPFESVSEATRGMGGIGLQLRDVAGRDLDELPADLRVREMPEGRS